MNQYGGAGGDRAQEELSALNDVAQIVDQEQIDSILESIVAG